MLESPRTLNVSSDEEPLQFQDWGIIPYQDALQRQLELVDEIAQTQKPGYLIFCSHPPVVTLGRSSKTSDVFDWHGETVEIGRGGRATYHGPSQLVIYPIANLKLARRNRGAQEVRGYLRELEEGIVEALADFGIESTGKSLQKKSVDEDAADETGVWVGDRKVASLGLGVRKWVTYHGAALNLDDDPQAFQGMNPCGFRRDVMVSVEELLNRPVDRAAFSMALSQILLRRL